MRVYFVNPPKNRAEIYKNMCHAEGLDTTAPPWGPTHLAAVTKELGHETSLIDSLAMNSSYEDTFRRILDFRPDALRINIINCKLTLYPKRNP